MKRIISIILFLISSSIVAQNYDASYDFYVAEISDIQINEILNFAITDLSADKEMTDLKNKLHSDLNTVASCVVHYKYSRTLKLTSDEQIKLENRIIEIADKFAEQNKYVLFRLTGGYAPITGVKDEMISDKKVLIVMLGGGCEVTEVEVKQEKIYKLFNERMMKAIAN